ncbi:flagellar biosynthesis anti-sigma factor FlgM [Polaromonas sp. CG_9.11]|uniref:flagellar biosynthesis anti-sigma factor FlgM n=1 Tax=Polaromonas sp. CG_9.11 TaxID=2787730 RepID=UPI0018CBE566|nr:flagellar biosynthesis anti-sigma factor FlgM [Polaromonas sp. CG_9.11]MBG6077842.1 negative regulator of flagellin synthesis FlgM [Polaromonas sp. CG_9.11]
MKINQNTPLLKAGAPAQTLAPGKSSAVAGASAAQATAVASQAKLPSTTGDFDAGRVAEIRESIRTGRYQVDTAKIADGLITSVRELIAKNPS